MQNLIKITVAVWVFGVLAGSAAHAQKPEERDALNAALDAAIEEHAQVENSFESQVDPSIARETEDVSVILKPRIKEESLTVDSNPDKVIHPGDPVPDASVTAADPDHDDLD